MDSVIGAIENLHQAKRKLQSAYPDIHMAYMLLNSNLDELEDMPDFFAKLKVNQVVVSSLSLVCSPDLRQESVLAETELQFSKLRFGNAFEHSLGQIWRDPDFRRFRKKHLKGELPGICQKCYKHGFSFR